MRSLSLGGLLLALAVSACVQESQRLPFEVDPDAPTTRTLGPDGGVLSTPRGFSLWLPPGALSASTSITVTYRGDPGAFPGPVDGEIVPGTVFEVDPGGLLLNVPGRLLLELAPEALLPDDLLRLGFAVEGPTAPLMVEDVSYDLTNGLLSGPVPALGTVAVRVAEDVLPLGAASPPDLRGGTFGIGASPAGAAEGLGSPSWTFRVRCGPTGPVPRCLDSDALRLWASREIRDRLSGTLVLVGPEVDGALTFGDFRDGYPTTAVGRFRVRGVLRVRLGGTVSSYEVDRSLSTGPGTTPSVTALAVEGNRLVFRSTSEGTDEVYPYELRRQGTGYELVVRAEQEVERENDDGSGTRGSVDIHLRVRR